MQNNLSRRTLLRNAALTAAAAPLLPTAALAQPPAPEKINLGLASYTFRNFSRAQLIGFMRDLRVSDLNAKNAKDHLPMDPAAEAQALSDYHAAGIRLHAAGAIYFQKATDDDIRTQFEYLKRANIPVMVAGDPSPENLPRIEQFVKHYDIRLAIHNHGPEDKLWPSPLDILKDIRTMDPRIGCCIDVGHTVRAGTDVVEAVHAVGPRLFNMHMKDLTDFHDKASQVAVGDGKIPIPEIFRALQQIRYPGFVDLEYEVHPDEPMPGVTKSFAYMRGVLAGMDVST
jgi:sugar phosphate isomerase/epimerase